MKGADLIAALKKKLRMETNRDLALKLGMSEFQLNSWNRSVRDLTPLKIANMVKSALVAEVSAKQSATIRPIVEYFPLDAVESRSGVKYELFPAGKDDQALYVGLREELKQSNGIYVFYDSRGRAIYCGKAKKQNLWGEMKAAFNRPRDTQTVYRVKHPVGRQAFQAAHERPRQPRETQLKLNDIATYFSAYAVDVGMIDDLEALLVRGFANDLLNVRMEKFVGARNVRKTRLGK